MAEYINCKYGGIVFPVATVTGGTPLLESCDPGLFSLLQFIKSLIEDYVGPAFLSAANGAEGITVSVGSIVPLDPLRISNYTILKFPILCGWRTEGRFNNRTTAWRQHSATVRIAYVLPPLSAETLFNLNPVLNAVEKIVDHKLFQAFDPGYNSGELVFTANGICNAKLTSSTRGTYQLAQDVDFDATVMELELEEREMPYVAGVTAEESYLQIDNSYDPDDPVLQVEVEDVEP
jgi:hypothetical protein